MMSYLYSFRYDGFIHVCLILIFKLKLMLFDVSTFPKMMQSLPI